MEKFERIMAFILVLAMSVFFCSCGAQESEKAPPTPLPTENTETVEEREKEAPATMPAETAAAVEDIALMFYTTEIQSEFTLVTGETVELWADVSARGAETPEVTWSSSDEESLALSFAEDKKEVSATALSAENGPVTLRLSCAGFEKDFTVYIHPGN